MGSPRRSYSNRNNQHTSGPRRGTGRRGNPNQQRRQQDRPERPEVVLEIELILDGKPLRYAEYNTPVLNRDRKPLEGLARKNQTFIVDERPVVVFQIPEGAKIEPGSVEDRETGDVTEYITVTLPSGGHHPCGIINLHQREVPTVGQIVCGRAFIMIKRVRQFSEESGEESRHAAYYLTGDMDDTKVLKSLDDAPEAAVELRILRGNARRLDNPDLGDQGHWQLCQSHLWLGEVGGSINKEPVHVEAAPPQYERREIGRANERGPRRRQEVSRAPVASAAPPKPKAPTPAANADGTNVVRAPKKGSVDGMRRLDTSNHDNPFAALAALNVGND